LGSGWWQVREGERRDGEMLHTIFGVVVFVIFVVEAGFFVVFLVSSERKQKC